jgi:hypothetical protein
MEPIHSDTVCVLCSCISILKEIHPENKIIETFFLTKREKGGDRKVMIRHEVNEPQTPKRALDFLAQLCVMSINESPTKRDISWTTRCRFSNKKVRFNLMMLGSPNADKFQEYLLRSDIVTEKECTC